MEHHPEEFDQVIKPDIAFRIRQGYAVEHIVRDYLGKQDDFEFQKTVQTERLESRFDVFLETPDGSHIYEVKSAKFIDPDGKKRKSDRKSRLYDLGFQVFAARESGLEIAKGFLITLNGEYRLKGSLDAEKFLVIEDVTEEIEAIQIAIEEKIVQVFDLLESEPEPGYEKLCSKKLKCEYFAYAMSDLPHPTIFNIPRLNKKKASLLLSMGVLDLKDIPEDFKLTDIQQDYVDFVKSGEKRIDTVAIRERLDTLEYPLYFLDYETVNPSIPQFDGMAPLQQITFQHSLHVKDSPESELKHHGFLSDGSDLPPKEVADHLASLIGEKGSVIVWYKHFEMARNREMGELYPEHFAFFESVNERIFDLYEIFSKKLYRDPAFASNSLKSVLPVLVPDMSYDEMEIGDGGAAMSRWYDEVYEGDDESKKTKTMESLRKYCEKDTFAMVEILSFLERL